MPEINAMEKDKAEYAIEQIQKAITEEMKIVSAGIAGKTYSLFELFSENEEQGYILDSMKFNDWVQACAEWMEQRQASNWVTAFSNLLYFCIEYLCLTFQPQFVDLYLVKKIIMRNEKKENSLYRL